MGSKASNFSSMVMKESYCRIHTFQTEIQNAEKLSSLFITGKKISIQAKAEKAFLPHCAPHASNQSGMRTMPQPIRRHFMRSY